MWKHKKNPMFTGIILLAAAMAFCYMIQGINTGNQSAYKALQLNQKYEMIDYWPDEPIDYNFFTNANQWHYHMTANEMAAAGVLLNYSRHKNIPEENWELRKMDTRYDENHIGVSTAFVKSESGREVFFFIHDLDGGEYFVIADIVKGNSQQTSVGEGAYSYDSSLPWYSYSEMIQTNNKSGYTILTDEDAYIYDAVYMEEGAFAMAEFLKRQGADKRRNWYLMKDHMYIGVNGYLADLWYTNGKQRVHLAIDIWNKLYTVVEII